MVLHSCRDCEHWPDCPYEQADDCPTLRAEMRGVETPRHEREKPFAHLDGFAVGDARRSSAHPLDEAREQGPEAVRALAVRLLKRAGFSLREIEDVCRTGWGRTKVRS